MERIGDNLRIHNEAFTISSALSATSQRYDMKDNRRVLICVGIGTSSTGWVGGSQSSISVLESSAYSATGAGTAITGATAVIGSTAANLVSKARSAIIQVTTAATDGNTIVINGTTFTNATAVSATGLVFGTTAGATAAAGTDPIVTSLTSLINAYVSGATASTLSTAAILVQAKTGTTSINMQSSAASPITCLYRSAQAIIEIDQDRMSTNTRFIQVTLSTVTTALQAGIAVIRSAGQSVSTASGNYTVLTT